MKFIFLFVTAFFLSSSSLRAQQTFPVEYTYITSPQGLSFDVRGGRTVKQGYSLTDLRTEKYATWGNGQWKKIRVFMMYRGAVKAAIVLEFSDSEGNVSYKCICGPQSPPSLFDQTRTDLGNLGKEWDYVLGQLAIPLARLSFF